MLLLVILAICLALSFHSETHKHTHAHEHTHTYTRTRAYTHTHTHRHTHTHTHTHARTHADTHTHTHTNTHTQTYMHTHPYTHTHIEEREREGGIAKQIYIYKTVVSVVCLSFVRNLSAVSRRCTPRSTEVWRAGWPVVVDNRSLDCGTSTKRGLSLKKKPGELIVAALSKDQIA